MTRWLCTFAGALLAVVACATGGEKPSPVLASFPDSAYASRAQLGLAADIFTPDIAKAFRAVREPPLIVGATASSNEQFRVTDLFAHGGAHVFRLEQREGGWELVRKVLLAQVDPDGMPPTMRSADSALVSAEQAATLIASIRDSDHWREPATHCGYGIDGYGVLMEARSRGAYVSQLCWSPESVSAPAIVATQRAFTALASHVLPALKTDNY